MKLKNAQQRVVALSLSALLCVSMVPIAGCAQSDKSGAGAQNKPTCAAEDPKGSANARTIGYDPAGYLKPEEKWATFEDGSLAMDIVQTHVFSNSDKQNITVKLDGHLLSTTIAPEDVVLTGGLAAWEPVSVDRVSDTELAIVAERDESVETGEGAFIAGVALDESCVQLVEADTSDESANMAEEGEVPAEGADGAQATSGAAVQSAAKNGIMSKLVPPAFADEEEVVEDPSPYEASIPFVHPSMLVDVEDTEVKDGKTVYRIVASEFSFPESVSADDFSVELASTAPEGAKAPEIESVKRLGDFEIEVVIEDDASKDDSLCKYAALRLSEQGSGTGGEVSCALELPEAWINARVVQVDEETVGQATEEAAPAEGEATDEAAGAETDAQEGDAAADADPDKIDSIKLNATVHNAEEDPDSLSVSALCADGTYREVDAASVEAAENGGTDITLDADKLADLVATDEDVEPVANDEEAAANAELAKIAAEDGYAILSVDADEVGLAYGGESNPDPALLCVPLVSSSMHFLLASAAPAGPSAGAGFDLVGALVSGGQGILGEIANLAWSTVRSEWFADTPIGERTNNQLYYSILKLQSDLSNMAATLDVLADKESAHYNANIVNMANAKIARIQSEYSLLGGLFNQVANVKGDQAATEAAIDKLMASKKPVVDNMIVDMSELYNTLKVADASTGTSLVGVYDNMAALSSNWGAAAAPGRQGYRDTIANVWAGCTTMLYVICGAENYKAEYDVSMNNLQSMTSDINTLLSNSSINEKDYVREANEKNLAKGNTFVKPGSKAYYNYTTNEWYTICPGDKSTVGWNEVFFQGKKQARFFRYWSTCPFIKWYDKHLTPSWGSLYLTTEQAKAMTSRLGPGGDIVAEIAGFAEITVPKYLLTSASFDMATGEIWHDSNNWSFDTYELSKGFTANKMHFEGDVMQKAWGKATRTTKSSTDLADMMVLARISVS